MIEGFPPAYILEAYCSELSKLRVSSLGAGNINDTYLVRSEDTTFVLQRINSRVFPHPLRVVKNFEHITRYFTSSGDTSEVQLQLAAPINSLEDFSHIVDEKGDFWRAQSYIPHCSKEVLSNECEARQTGVILAGFHSRLIDFDGSKLEDPLPGFHNLPMYLQAFDRALRSSNRRISKKLEYCLEVVDKVRGRAATLKRAMDTGALKCQPVHGDPKLDNFLFNENNQCFGLLDLDTVAMGLVHHDLGDCLRSCCNKAGEGAEDTRQVVFDLQMCRALLDGYLSVARGFDQQQRYYIYDGVLLICFELGLRFLTDYLEGNHYFKVENENDNLLKAENQFRLAVDVSYKEDAIRHLVETVASLYH
ncbi:MAG: phosphotransferase enzyme family protein [Desulforhopalus sp.]